MTRVDLVENGEPQVTYLDAVAGQALADTGLVDARHLPGTDAWELRPTSKVGAVRVGRVEVRVAPKVPIDRVMFLLGWSTRGADWRDEPVTASPAPDLLVAIAESFTRLAERATRAGLLQGYREVTEALPVVRGRIREADQLRRRFAMAVPIEVRYDDYTVDIAENRLLRHASRRLLRVAGLPHPLRHRLTRLEVRLSDAGVAGPAGDWHPSRLNAHYVDALHLAELVLAGSSFEHRGSAVTATGFVLDMATVFEDFVCRELQRALSSIEGEVSLQPRDWSLDADARVPLRPDLVWQHDQHRPLAVLDAKYKAERPAGYPNADVYQLLAYCTALRLPDGHLLYAKGNETAQRYRIRGAAVTIHAHALDLSLSPTDLLGRLDELAALMHRTALGRGTRQMVTSVGSTSS